MPEIYLVMYSKYSSASTRFLALLESTTMKDICTMVCIDNSNIRKRIMNHDKLSIKEVPCVIRIFPETGYTELFEGERAFSLLKNFVPPPPPSPSLPPPPPVTPIQNIQKPVENVSSLSDLVTPLPGPKLPQQMSVKQHLKNVDNDQEENNKYLHVPKNPTFEEIDLITPPPNNYLQEIEKENLQRGIPEQRSIKSNSGNGGGSITLRAQQMQKEREQEISSSPGIRA